MAVYTVFQPPQRAEEMSPDPERFVFVRDRFCFTAFLFAPIWLLWHRLWIAFIGYLIIGGGLVLAVAIVTRSQAVTAVVALLLAVLMGFEAPTLWRWTLTRRGWHDGGVIVGDDLESAERRFFEGWSTVPPSAPVASTPATLPRAPLHDEVIGLFPESGTTR